MNYQPCVLVVPIVARACSIHLFLASSFSFQIAIRNWCLAYGLTTVALPFVVAASKPLARSLNISKEGKESVSDGDDDEEQEGGGDEEEVEEEELIESDDDEEEEEEEEEEINGVPNFQTEMFSLSDIKWFWFKSESAGPGDCELAHSRSCIPLSHLVINEPLPLRPSP